MRIKTKPYLCGIVGQSKSNFEKKVYNYVSILQEEDNISQIAIVKLKKLKNTSIKSLKQTGERK